MELNAQDIITALSNQRNAALNELAQAFAIIEAQKREIEELKKPKDEYCASETRPTIVRTPHNKKEVNMRRDNHAGDSGGESVF